ncbi:AAA family ATPase [Deinococcus cellulosilyticus]|uniref:Bacterial transcriptional activator domain-containing protein n=1 Tax=Deinococcus cellulosilyticus (strain DSM 18568 / NBRC 106333 / KACC 11606 / 5516J-15) TaxID=1223518 RepID=A0A511MYS2_DEIC1|nr:AAA family ATPase [Deinococcus cellulosilyticus]GEM45672.1 hypothetical protein DC3_13070 [Deinococcus cellulosilyticus NBRC 106333 = KACC 11606]
MPEPLVSLHNRSFQTLLDLWKATHQEGLSGMAQIEGEAGLGKSSLLERFAHQLDPSQVVHVRRGHLLRTLVLHFAEAFNRTRNADLIEAARSHCPDHPWVRLLPSSGAADPTRTLLAAVSWESQNLHGLCLLVDDVHAMPEDDLEVLQALWSRVLLDHSPVLMVLASRPLETETPAVQAMEALQKKLQLATGLHPRKVELQRLHHQEVRDLTVALLGAAPPDSLLQWLEEHGEGHPLYTRELLHLLRQGGVLRKQHFVWTFLPPENALIPHSLQQAIRQRLERLGDHLHHWRAAVVLAAVDEALPLQVWAHIAGCSSEQMEVHAEQLRGLGVVSSRLQAGEVLHSLTHPLYGSILREAASAAELQKVHLQAVEVLTDPVQRAWHARRGQHVQQLEFTREAFQHARQHERHAEVVQEARAWLWLDPQPPVEVRAGLLAALMRLNRVKEALQVKPFPGDFSSQLQIARALDETGQQEQALQVLQSLHPLPVDHPDVQGYFIQRLFLEFQLNRLDQAEQTLQDFEQWAVAHPQAASLHQVQLGELQYRKGLFRAAHNTMQQALDHLSDVPDPAQRARVLMDAGSMGIMVADFEASEKQLREAITEARVAGDIFLLNRIEANLGYLLLMQGRYPESEPLHRELLSRFEAAGNLRVTSAVLWNLGILRLWRGDFQQAFDVLCRSADLITHHQGAKPTDIAEAEAFLGHIPAALARLEEAHHNPYMEHPLIRARIHLLAGQPEQARLDLEQVKPEDGPGVWAKRCLIEALLQHTLTGKGQPEAKAALQAARLCRNEALIGEALLTLAALQTPPDPQVVEEGWKHIEACDAWGHLHLLQKLCPSGFQAIQRAPVPSVSLHEEARLCLLGPTRRVTGHEVQPWKGRKVKEMLALLLIASLRQGTGGVPRETLQLALWPEASMQAADTNFRKTVIRLREALGRHGTIKWRRDGSYHLVHLQCDLSDFLAALQRGHLEQALSLYTGPLMQDLDLPELHPLRSQLQEQWRRAVLQLAEEQDWAQRPGLYARLLEHNPCDLDAHLKMIEVYQHLEDFQAAKQHHLQACLVFADHFGEVPGELQHLSTGKKR